MVFLWTDEEFMHQRGLNATAKFSNLGSAYKGRTSCDEFIVDVYKPLFLLIKSMDFKIHLVLRPKANYCTRPCAEIHPIVYWQNIHTQKYAVC
jgi:hypothetical protein